MDSTSWLWIGTALMTIGGLAIFAVGKRRTPAEELQTVLHGIVPLIAACLYFAMACGQGGVLLPTVDAATSLPATRVFYFGRYIDWSVTTPLLLISLAMNAMHSGRKRVGIIAGALVSDVMMIVTSFCFGAAEIAWIKWVWFLVSCLAFLGVYYTIWVSGMEANRLERDDVRTNYRRNAVILSALWLVYPFILAVSPDGLGVVSGAFSVAFIMVLDVVAKVVYGLLSVSSDARIVDRDLAEGSAIGTAPGYGYADAPRAAI